MYKPHDSQAQFLFLKKKVMAYSDHKYPPVCWEDEEEELKEAVLSLFHFPIPWRFLNISIKFKDQLSRRGHLIVCHMIYQKQVSHFIWLIYLKYGLPPVEHSHVIQRQVHINIWNQGEIMQLAI